ncbi:N-acetyltransferase [Desulfocurvibacter africanus]|uniref:N-acetyltransferase n=1 Tax=Desulfocurvibacter africanus TaxID=873 RepID=UPI0003FE0277|nr:N-acetyltransferase [Desulfocurvibacter africanus]
MEAYTIRKASMSDIKVMHRLLMSCAQKSQLLPRSLNSLYGHVRDFYVAEEIATGTPVGCCALTICWEDLAEVRSLALDEAHKGRGVGRAMVQTCLDEASQLGLSRVFALTYVVDFFRRCGFSEVEKDTLPQKVWSDCINCPKFPECDETAMLITLPSR